MVISDMMDFSYKELWNPIIDSSVLSRRRTQSLTLTSRAAVSTWLVSRHCLDAQLRLLLPNPVLPRESRQCTAILRDSLSTIISSGAIECEGKPKPGNRATRANDGASVVPATPWLTQMREQKASGDKEPCKENREESSLSDGSPLRTRSLSRTGNAASLWFSAAYASVNRRIDSQPSASDRDCRSERINFPRTESKIRAFRGIPNGSGVGFETDVRCVTSAIHLLSLFMRDYELCARISPSVRHRWCMSGPTHYRSVPLRTPADNFCSVTSEWSANPSSCLPLPPAQEYGSLRRNKFAFQPTSLVLGRTAAGVHVRREQLRRKSSSDLANSSDTSRSGSYNAYIYICVSKIYYSGNCVIYFTTLAETLHAKVRCSGNLLCEVTNKSRGGRT